MIEIRNKLKTRLKPFIPFLLKANEPWLIGGAIRDTILGLPIKDYDFVIKNKASEFAKWFAQKLNATFVLLDVKLDESRVIYKPENRKPKTEIIFDFTHMESIEQDLVRRDFRLNTIAAKLPEMELFDPLDGLKDIDKKRIKMVSEQSLLEDPLRVLRGFRFNATLEFKIERETLKALAEHKKLLQKVAPERLHEELFELLGAKNSYKVIRQMAKLGVLQIIIPEIEPMEKVPQGKPDGNLLDHSLLTVKRIEQLCIPSWQGKTPIPVLKLGALLHDLGKPYCYSEDEDGRVHFYGHEQKGVELLDSIRERLRLSNYELKSLQSLIRYHMRPHLLARERTPTDKAIWRLVRDGGDETPGILLLAYADALASGGQGKKKLQELLGRGISLWEEMRRPKFRRILTGDDLIKLGLPPGPIFKKILEKVEELQISGELHTREEAIQFVIKNLNRRRDD